MNKGKYVFAQLTEFLPQRVFDGFAAKYSGNKYVRHFTCWNQLLCMIFGQLTNRDSLRDLIVAIDAHSLKTYHLGFGKSVTRSNFAKSNENRNSKMFEEFADSFVASYGLGPSLTSGLAKLTKDAGVVDLKTLSFLNYVPILNLYLAWSSSWAEADLSLRHGYATSSNRLATGYQTLDYELGHNKDLSDGDKKDIKAQMDEMAKTYDEYIKRPGAKNFTFKLIHQIVNKKIDDEKTDIKENILDILQAHKDEIEKLPSIDPDLQGDMAEAMKKSMRQFSQDALAALKTAKVEQ